MDRTYSYGLYGGVSITPKGAKFNHEYPRRKSGGDIEKVLLYDFTQGAAMVNKKCLIYIIRGYNE